MMLPSTLKAVSHPICYVWSETCRIWYSGSRKPMFVSDAEPLSVIYCVETSGTRIATLGSLGSVTRWQ